MVSPEIFGPRAGLRRLLPEPARSGRSPACRGKRAGGQAMTQAALQFDAHTLLLGLLGMVSGFLAYWGTRLEQRVDELKARQCLLAEEMHKSYVPREDCRERTARNPRRAGAGGRKTGSHRGRNPYRGALTCAESAGTPPSFADASAAEHRRGDAGNGPGRTSPSSGGRIFPHYCLVGGDLPASRMAGCGTAPHGGRARRRAAGDCGPARGGQEHVRFRCFSCCGPCQTGRKRYISRSVADALEQAASLLRCGQGQNSWELRTRTVKRRFSRGWQGARLERGNGGHAGERQNPGARRGQAYARVAARAAPSGSDCP